MQIVWYGQSCFQITSTQDKNPVSIIIDPFEESYVGLKLPRKMEADIVLSTHEHKDHGNVKKVEGNPFVIAGPGEYDIKGISINGIFSYHDNSKGKERGTNTIYTISAEDINVCHLGDLGQKELTTEQLERMGEVDVLMIPIGGAYTIDAGDALKVMSQIEPKIIIPMHYRLPGLEIKLSGVEEFLKHLGIKSPEPLPKLSLKKRDLQEDEARIVVLKP